MILNVVIYTRNINTPLLLDTDSDKDDDEEEEQVNDSVDNAVSNSGDEN